MLEIALTCCGLALAGLLAAEGRESQGGRWLCKPVASLAFVAAGWAAGAAHTPYGRLVLLGLALGLVGDVLLIPRREATFLAGLVTFLAGHVAYVAAFSAGRAAAGWPTALVCLAIVPTAVGLHRWLLPHVPAPMAWPVRAYLLVICAMLVASTLAPPQAQPHAVVGAVAFFLSDICVARDKFVAAGARNRFVGLPLYYGGQILLALSAAR